MEAVLHAIEGRARRDDVAPCSFDDFRLGAGERVSSRMVVETPGWTPYVLDCATRRALFVELDPDADLAEAVFAHTRQWREARRVLIVPFAALDSLAAAVPPPARVIFVFNTGRSGSTLLNALLNEIEGVWSLSEPDVYLDVSMRRATLDPEDLRSLLLAGTRLLFRPPAGRPSTILALKFRADVFYLAEALHAVFPQAASVFSYRDGVAWAKSFCYFMRSLGVPDLMDRRTQAFVWPLMSGGAEMAALAPYADLEAEGIHPEELLAPAWAFYMDEYLRLRAAGLPLLPVRYDELDGDREATVARLLAHCGLPAAALAPALRAFGRDSQQGTAIARGRRDASFGPVNAERFRRTLARHPRITDPDLRLPG